jgi:rod shape-determining protein MreC
VASIGRLRSTRLLVFGLLLASLVTITIDARGGERGPLATAGRVLGGIIGPLQEGVSAVFRPIGSFFSNVFRAGSLAEQVAQLETENAELRTAAQEVSELLAENREYEALLDIAADLDFGLIGATVVGDSVSNLEWSVTINKGSDDGVEEDMAVIGPFGLVGRVVRTFDTAAQVMLIIDPGSKVSARLSSSRERALVEGQGEGLLRLSLVDPEAEIQPGEVVETSGYQFGEGYTGLYPSGIPIGVVDAVEPADDGVTVSVLVRPNTPFSQLDKLGLVTGVPNLAEELRG